jgi:hypothetical protein
MSVEPGVYLHFKGTEYTVLGEAKHSETKETFVLYTDGHQYWVRPVDMFKGNVDGKPRFKFLRPIADDAETVERRRRFSRDICGNE